MNLLKRKKNWIGVIALGLGLGAAFRPAALPFRAAPSPAVRQTFFPVLAGPESVQAKDLNELLARTSRHPEAATPAELRSLAAAAAALPREALDALAQTAISPAATGNERSFAVFLLTRGNPALIAEPLQTVAGAPPSSAKAPADSTGETDLNSGFEIGLALRALEDLDRLAAKGDPKARDAIHQIYDSPQSPATVRRVAEISWKGILDGHPGRVAPFMDRILREASR